MELKTILSHESHSDFTLVQKWVICRRHQELEYFASELIIMYVNEQKICEQIKTSFFALKHLSVRGHFHMDPYFHLMIIGILTNQSISPFSPRYHLVQA